MIKRKKSENLTESNIKHVIQLLSAKDAITKKEACAILNIAYNTSRLNNIIEGFKDGQKRRQRILKKKRGTPASKEEIRSIVEEYLEGSSLVEISKSVYRSVGFVKRIIETVGVPAKPVGDEKYMTEYLPEECVSYEFSAGDIVWSARHHTSCEVREQIKEERYGCPVYWVWVNEQSEFSGAGGFNAAIAAYDLGRLKHLQDYGVKI